MRSFGPCLHLIEQAHILDRDHRLVGKSLDQLNLTLIRKGLDDLPCQCKDADGFAPEPEGNSKVGSVAAKSSVLQGHLTLRLVGKQINGLNRNARCCCTSCGGCYRRQAADWPWRTPQIRRRNRS